jgi:alpha-tubulin suppressor-like RCC1 family protein
MLFKIQLGALGRSVVALALFAGLLFSPAPASAKSWVRIDAGVRHSCGVMATGVVKCWGTNASSALGTRNPSASKRAVKVVDLGGPAQSISAGYDFTCGVVLGSAKCWGEGRKAQRGDGTLQIGSTPVQVVGLTSGVTAVSAGSRNACAIVSGAAKCWGYGAGVLGVFGNQYATTPVQIPGLETGVTSIAVGNLYGCAIVSGAVMCWGSNVHGELGSGLATYSNLPVQVLGLESGATALTAGGDHACAIVNGGAQCWGANGTGQLGNGSISNSLVPVPVRGLGSSVTSISASLGGEQLNGSTVYAGYTCAVVKHSARCWGYNGNGRLGNGTTVASVVPVAVKGLNSGVSSIDAGGSNTCALVRRHPECWGRTYWLRFDVGGRHETYVPRRVPGT